MQARKCFLAKVNDLIPPQGATVDESTVAMLAESIQQYGLREPIVVVGRHILHGVHRWEAARRNGEKTIEAVEDTQAETAQANDARVIVENLHRRHMLAPELDAMRAKLVLLRTAQIAQQRQSVPKESTVPIGKPVTNKNPPRKKPSPRGDAIRQVAKETNTTEAAVKKSVARVDAIVQNRVAKSIESGRVSDLDEYRNPIPAKLIDRWDSLRRLHSEIDATMRKAQKICTELAKFGGESASHGQRWKESLHAVGAESRSYEPYALCPKCGGKGCNICRKVGFVCDGTLPRKKYERMIGE